jgi:hypothetical protein
MIEIFEKKIPANEGSGRSQSAKLLGNLFLVVNFKKLDIY